MSKRTGLAIRKTKNLNRRLKSPSMLKRGLGSSSQSSGTCTTQAGNLKRRKVKASMCYIFSIRTAQASQTPPTIEILEKANRRSGQVIGCRRHGQTCAVRVETPP
jgi:hypothetical protein